MDIKKCEGCALDSYMPSDVSLFWKYVDIKGPDECWIWMGGLGTKGYGMFNIRRRSRTAHRVSFTIENGPIPSGVKVRHTCDNPPCVNPAHLIPGTDQDNVDDRVARGRSAVGERAGRAILTEPIIRAMRRDYKNGESTRTIARKYDTSSSNVWKVVTYQSWVHLPQRIERTKVSHGNR